LGGISPKRSFEVLISHYNEKNGLKHDKEKSHELGRACLAHFASSSAVLFASLLIFIIENCLPLDVSVNSETIGLKDQ